MILRSEKKVTLHDIDSEGEVCIKLFQISYGIVDFLLREQFLTTVSKQIKPARSGEFSSCFRESAF